MGNLSAEIKICRQLKKLWSRMGVLNMYTILNIPEGTTVAGLRKPVNCRRSELMKLDKKNSLSKYFYLKS